MKIQWKSERRKLADIKDHPENPRQATKEQLDAVRASLDKFELCDPLIINQDGTLIGGHVRKSIMLERGDTEADVRVPDRLLTPDEVKELLLRLNKNTASWNPDMLAGFDQSMLLQSGWTQDEMDKLLGGKEEAEPTTDVKRGDVYRLGQHIISCGDIKRADEVSRLLGSEKTELAFGTINSASVLEASAQMGKKCRMMHKDPRVIDKIIKEWESKNGKKAEKI